MELEWDCFFAVVRKRVECDDVNSCSGELAAAEWSGGAGGRGDRRVRQINLSAVCQHALAASG